MVEENQVKEWVVGTLMGNYKLKGPGDFILKMN